MYLVDTSIWINYLRDRETKAVRLFSRILDQRLPFGLTGLIYQEVLQAAFSPDDFQALESYLGSQRFYHLRDPVISYRQAAEIFFKCRRSGVTIRSTLDCLIAEVALEYDLILLHDDHDFIRIGRVVPELKLASREPV